MTQLNTSSTQVTYTQKPNTTLLVVALALGLIAAFAFVWRVENVRKAAEIKSIVVYRVTRSFDPGEVVKRNDLEQFRIPEGFEDSFPGALRTATDLSNWIDQKKPVLKRINQGDVLTTAAYTAADSGRAFRLSRGKELVTFSVDRDSAPPVLVPEMYVNIWAAITPKGGTPDVELVMERVRVIVVGSRTASQGGSRSSRAYSTISVEVTSKESQLLNKIVRMLDNEEFIITIRDQTDTSRKIIGGSINPKLLDMLNIKSK